MASPIYPNEPRAKHAKEGELWWTCGEDVQRLVRATVGIADGYIFDDIVAIMLPAEQRCVMYRVDSMIPNRIDLPPELCGADKQEARMNYVETVWRMNYS